MLLLPLEKVFAFTNATLSSRNMIEGEKVIKSGMVIMCGASSTSRESIEIYALCLQTSALTSDPHEITGLLNIRSISNISSDEVFLVEINKMTCSCKAGTSQACKHIVAVLLYCNRRDVKSLQLISSTDKKCLWKKDKSPILEQFEAEPTKNFCCIKQDRLPALSKSVVESIRNRLINCNKETTIAKHRYRNTNMTLVLNNPHSNENVNINTRVVSRIPLGEIQNKNRSLLNSNRLVNTQCIEEDYMKCIIDKLGCSKELDFLKTSTYQLADCCNNIYQKRIICSDVLLTATATKSSKAKWKKERKFRITGSRCYNLYTYSKDDWPEKARKYFWAKEFTNKYVRHGNKYESVARTKYSKENNLYVEECGLIVSMAEPWLAYSPDGVVIKDKKPYRLLEIKCPVDLENTSNEVLKKKCKFIQIIGNRVTVRIKHQYYAQVQCGMALLNLKDCDLVVYSSISNCIKIINIAYDQKYVENMFSKFKRIYFEKMLHEICKNSRTV